jgi:hypothetical protein
VFIEIIQHLIKYKNMAFVLSFTTTDYNEGKSILVQDASTGTPWPTLTAAQLVVTSLYSGVVLTPATATITYATAIVSGFSLEIKNTDLGFASTETIPDGVYRIVMTVTGSSDTYTGDEVVYYNAVYTRDNFFATKAAYLDEIYNKDQDYANWLDILVTGIEANTLSGNSSAVYYILDIFDRINT